MFTDRVHFYANNARKDGGELLGVVSASFGNGGATIRIPRDCGAGG